MARNCIVKSCPNRKDKCYKTKVSFFGLPTNEVIREGWFQKIGEISLPSNIKHAKICSVHFTEDSFHIGKKQKSGKCLNRRRLLLPNAFPTKMLSSTENKANNVIMDLNIIRREFLLSANAQKSIDEKSNNNDEPLSTSQISDANDSSTVLDNSLTEENKCIIKCEIVTDPLHPENISTDPISISDTVVNIETPKNHVERKLWMDEKKIFETPQNTSNASNTVHFNTFPRRLQKVKHLRNHRIVSSIYTKMEKRQITASGLKNLKIPSRKRLEEYHNESTPSCVRKRRFMMENCNNITDSTHKSQNEDSYTSKLLKAELNHRSFNELHVPSKCNYLDEMKETEKEYQNLRLQLAQKNEDIQNLIKDKEQMQLMINDLQAKLMVADLNKHNLEKTAENKMLQTLQCYFTKKQIKCIIKNRKWIRFSIEDYASAISFYSISPKAYKYFLLKLNFPLPSLYSLRRWALKKFDIREGFLSDVLAIMREKGDTFTYLEKITVLTFDEITVSPEVQFDSKIEKLVGPYGKVQVIMARGLLGNWKQPIYYKFDQPMTKDILMKAVCRLYDAGYEVVATTSDIGNKEVWKELQITPDNHFIKHPVLKDGKIFVFADISHLLILLRNWFVDEGFLIEHCSKPFTAEIIQAIIDMDTPDDLCAHHLTRRILNARHSMTQAVKPAAQIWSHTVAKAIKSAGDCGLINVPDYKKFSDFVLTVNKWFDVHNSQQKYGAHPGVNGFGVDINNQEIILILMNLYIQNMRVGSRKSLMLFQKDILISNASLQRLYDYLKSKYPQEFHYILTKRLQQDVLENFFASIRAIDSCKDHPSVYEFKYRLKWYILGKHSHAMFSINRKSEDVDTSCISSSIACEPSSILSEIPSPTSNTPLESSLVVPMNNMPKCSSTCETFSNYSYSEITDHSQDEIILTKELLSSIINISSEQLQEDSAHNDDDDLEKNMDDDDDYDNDDNDDNDDPFVFESNCTELYALYSENASRDIIQETDLKYVAGYIAHRFKRKYPHLGKPISTTTDDSMDVNWIQCVSKGYLMYPSDELIHISKIVEKCFNNFHNDYFCREDSVIQKVIALVKGDTEYYPCIPDEVLHYLVRTRTYIRIREINKRQYAQNKEIKKEEE